MSFRTIKYDGKINFTSFICSEQVLNDYLHSRAKDEHENKFCVLYFLLDANDEVVGFYVLNNGSISRDEQLPTAKARRNLKYNSLGTVHIGRLARHKDKVGLKIGQHLMYSALTTAIEASNISAAWAITVDAKKADVEKYYQSFGFVPLKQIPDSPEYPKPMYMKTTDAQVIVQN